METITINIYGIDYDIDYEFTKGEPTVWYYSDGSGYPGSPDSIEIFEARPPFPDFFDIEVAEEKILDELNRY